MSGYSAPGKDVCHKSSGCAASPTVEAANEFLRNDWIAMHDASFSVKAEQTGTAFLPYRERNWRRSSPSSRNASSTTTTRCDTRSRCLQIPQQTFRFSLARCRVLVCEHLDQTITVHYGHHVLGTMTRQGSYCGSGRIRNRSDAANRTALLINGARRTLDGM